MYAARDKFLIHNPSLHEYILSAEPCDCSLTLQIRQGTKAHPTMRDFSTFDHSFLSERKNRALSVLIYNTANSRYCQIFYGLLSQGDLHGSSTPCSFEYYLGEENT